MSIVFRPDVFAWRVLRAIAVALLLIPFATAAADAERVEVARYFTTTEAPYWGVVTCDELRLTIGGACFDIRPGESHVELDVRDESGLTPVNAQAVFRDAAGNKLNGPHGPYHVVCDHAVHAVPAGAVSVSVHVKLISHGYLFDGFCDVLWGFSFATTGTMTARFT